MEPFIALNFKAYAESLGNKGLALAKAARDVSRDNGVRIIVCPQFVDLWNVSALGVETFGQGASDAEQGAHTGAVTLESLKGAGCRGLLVNHAENRIPKASIEKIIARSKKLGLETMLCTKDVPESVELAKFNPTYIAIEPPELIGSGISVSTAKPEIVKNAVDAVAKVSKSPVICGAGVSTGTDVKKAVELGAKGVLLASAYVNSKDPKKLLEEFAKAIA
ncbi:MAG TPA: triose-phosphate isomerase [Candidatus Micrarchaeota archaeon]|nr:triose-phosphate isomerase [Candidatus Micrarchaeota archaeon]